MKKIREEVGKFISNEEACLLFKDFYKKALSSPAGDLTFAKWVATLGTVDLHTLDRLLLELTCPPLARAPGMLETFGAGSKSAAALLFLGMALENSKIESLAQVPPLATRASINAVAFVKIAFLAKTGVNVELKTEKALLMTTPVVDEILGGPYASQRESSPKKEDLPEYSERERGVGDEAFQDLMKKVMGK